MDDRLRRLERAAASGDELAAEQLKAMLCRANGHLWKYREELLKVFPRVEYKTVRECCKRCGHIENPPKPKLQRKASTGTRMVNRYAYGTVAELQREIQKIETEPQ